MMDETAGDRQDDAVRAAEPAPPSGDGAAGAGGGEHGDGGDPDGASDRLAHIIESVLFAAASPVSLRRLVDILAGPTSREVQTALAQVKERYAPGHCGIQLQEVAGGYQLRTARENAEWVRAIFRERPARLGRAALETLAIVAYKQPVTRADIEVIRGVDVDGVLTTLLSRRLIKIAGRKEAVGRPLLYATTPEFLETFGLKDLGELPALKELGPVPETEDGSTSTSADSEVAGAPAIIADSGDPAPPAFAADAAATDDTAAATALAAADGGTGTVVAAGAPGTAAAEDPEPSGGDLTTAGGGHDPRGAGTGERPPGDAARDEGEPTDRSDHD